MPRFAPVTCGMLSLVLFVANSFAGGLIPDRANKVLIEGRFSNPQQPFALIFSARPLSDDRGRPANGLTLEQVKSFANTREQVLIKVYGKQQTKPGTFEFFFGPGDDQDQPWNDGRDFAWESWSQLSPDIWDNLSVVASIDPSAKNVNAVIANVELVRGDKLLYDSRKRESYPNKQRVDAGFSPFNAVPRRTLFPVLNLGEAMAGFRRDFYELGDNPLLHTAYADLGQTEKSKYANRGVNWCSEFASWVYRDNGLMTPDPNRSDVHFRNMRVFFSQQGQVYPMRDVAGWSDQEKLARIKPGSFVSMLIGDSTHSLIFTTWIRNARGPITQYTAISGNNKAMVWAHAPQKLPDLQSLSGMTSQQLAEYDEKAYFAVPPDTVTIQGRPTSAR